MTKGKFGLMDNGILQGLVAGVVGLNTLATFGLAFAIGCYKGNLDEWRRLTDTTLHDHKEQIATIRQQDTKQVLIDAQLTRQLDLIKLLGKRTHDLKNVLTAAMLQRGVQNVEMQGFDEPVSGGD